MTSTETGNAKGASFSPSIRATSEMTSTETFYCGLSYAPANRIRATSEMTSTLEIYFLIFF